MLRKIVKIVIVLSTVSLFGCSSVDVNADDIMDITNRNDLVGICYSNWFNPLIKDGVPIYDISKILADNPEDPQWGPVGIFHYWAEPALGYYRSDNAKVIRTHMEQLRDAGVDFIVLDNTNMSDGWSDEYKKEIFYDSCKILLDTVKKMQDEKLSPPHVVIWCPDNYTQDMYTRFYSKPEYKDVFVYWNDGDGLKPFIITTNTPEEAIEDFTVRKMWGLQNDLPEKEWSFLQLYPQNVSYNGSVPEQITVSPAQQETYISAPTAHGREGGLNFKQQWKTAFDTHPKFVILTWWNEWAAQRFLIDGKTEFTDNYTREFSRDLEPMKGGHGDLYYQFMKEYIRAYKTGEECPTNLIE